VNSKLAPNTMVLLDGVDVLTWSELEASGIAADGELYAAAHALSCGARYSGSGWTVEPACGPDCGRDWCRSRVDCEGCDYRPHPDDAEEISPDRYLCVGCGGRRAPRTHLEGHADAHARMRARAGAI